MDTTTLDVRIDGLNLAQCEEVILDLIDLACPK
jgi:hypothetical protein